MVDDVSLRFLSIDRGTATTVVASRPRISRIPPFWPVVEASVSSTGIPAGVRPLPAAQVAAKWLN